MKKFIQIIFFAGIVLGIHLFAETKGMPIPVKKSPFVKKPQLEQIKSFDHGYPTNQQSLEQGYAYPGRICVRDEWDFYAYLSFLYWQMIADGYDFIYHYNINTKEYKAVRWPHKWKPALKFGLAMTFHNHDDWQMLAEYLRYYSMTKVSAEKKSGSEDSLNIVQWVYSTEAQKADGSLHVGLDAVNFSLARPYYLGSKFILNPFFGLHAAWIHQEVLTNYYTIELEEDVRVPGEYRSKDWSLGPRIGFDSKYLLGKGVRFFGKGAFSLNYRRKHCFTQTHYYTGLSSKKLKQSQSTNPYEIDYADNSSLRPELELGGGFGWSTYLDDYQWHLDLSVGYDMYLIFKEQNIPHEVLDHLYGAWRPMDLCLHGLTITARLDF